jgi:integrase
MSVYKRNERWYFDRMIDGIRHRRVIPEARTRDEARRAEARIIATIYDGKYNPEAKRRLFDEFVSDTFLPYSKTNKRSHYDDVLITRTLLKFFDGLMLDEITPATIEKFKQERSVHPTKNGTQRKPATVNREMSVLSRIFTMAVNEGLLTENPCRKVRKLRMDNSRTRYLTADEKERLMHELESQPLTRCIVIMALNTGMRQGEIFNLKWSDVDFTREVITVRKTKTGKDRTIPMNDRLKGMLGDLRNESVRTMPDNLKREKPSPGGFVFVSPQTGKRLNNIKRSFKNACKRAGIDNFTFHDLRHSAGTRLADAGVNIVVIADILGHSRLTTTQRYTHAIDEAKREAMQTLG